MRDILERLRVDGGQVTFATLIQEREAAANEIVRLRSIIDRLTVAGKTMRKGVHPALSVGKFASPPPQLREGSLLRLSDICQLFAVSHSSVYRWISDGAFPQPLRVSDKSVRWRAEDIRRWRDSLETWRDRP